MEFLDSVVKILGVGLSGFGFLLMYLAYKLIHKVIEKQSNEKMVFQTVNRYMLVCVSMTIAVGFFTYFTSFYRNKELESQAIEISDTNALISILKSLHELEGIKNSIASSDPVKDSVAYEMLISATLPIMDSLQKSLYEISEERADSNVIFAREQVTLTRDSIESMRKAKDTQAVNSILRNTQRMVTRSTSKY